MGKAGKTVMKSLVDIAAGSDNVQQVVEIQEAFLQISETVYQSRDLDSFYVQVHQIIAGLIPAKNIFIALYDEKTGMVNFQYFVDEKDQQIFDRSIRLADIEKSLTAKIIKTGAPILLNADESQKLKARDEVDIYGRYSRSWLGVPLRIGEKIIGVLAVQEYHLPGLYTERDRDILAFISSQVALAIERKQNEISLMRRDAIFQSISYAAEVFLSANDWIISMHELLGRLGQATGSDYVLVYENEQDDSEGFIAHKLYEWLKADKNLLASVKSLDRFPYKTFEGTEYLRQIKRGKPLYVTVNALPASYRDFINELGIKQFIVSPILAAGKWWGLLVIACCAEQLNWQTVEIDAIKVAVDILGAAIHRKNIADSETRQRQLTDAWHEAGIRLTASLTVDQVLDHLIDQVGSLLGFDIAMIMSVEKGKAHPVRIREEKKHPKKQLKDISSGFLDVQNDHYFKLMNETGHPVIIPDASSDPAWKPVEELARNRSWLQAPIFSGGGLEVYFLFGIEQPEYYRREDAEYLVNLTNQATLAIQKIQLFDEVTESLKHEHRMNEVARVMTSDLGLETVLKNVARLATELLGGDAASIALLSPDRQFLVSFYEYNLPPQANREPIPRNIGLAWQIIDAGKPMVFNDYPQQPGAKPDLIKAGIKSAMGVPITSNEGCVGSLAIFMIAPDKQFSRRDIDLAETIGRQASVAIKNARLFEAEQQRVCELDTLRAVMTSISAELDLDRLLKDIMVRAVALLKATNGEIGLYNESQHYIEIVVCYNFDRDYTGVRMELGEGGMGKVAQMLQPLVINDYSTWVGRSPQYTVPSEAILMAPLLAGGQLVGVIGVGDTTRNRKFGKDDIALMNLFAQQATIAIRNARLYDIARQRAGEADSLRKATAAVVSFLNLDQVLACILQELEKVVPYDSASVFLLEGESLHIVATQGMTYSDALTDMSFPANDPLLLSARKSRKPIILHDAASEPNFHRWGGTSYVHGWMGVPMMIRDQLVGYITLDSHKIGSFEEGEAKLAQAFADQAAVSIQNARLFKEVHEMAITDSLTGVFNRRHLFEIGRREFERSRRYKRPLAAIMLDLDFFKRINDTYGHPVGDQVLQQLAVSWRDKVREIDVFARYGGEEFMILLPEADIKLALQVAERLRLDTEKIQIPLKDTTISITVSLGVAERTSDCLTLETLLEHADQALYVAKQSGRNRVSVWQEKKKSRH